MKPNVYTRHHDFRHSHFVNRYVCSQCECCLNESWKYCPICGEEIDWNDLSNNIIDIYITLNKEIIALTNKNQPKVRNLYINNIKDKISLDTLNRIHIPSHVTKISNTALTILFNDLIVDEYYSYIDFLNMVDIICASDDLKNEIHDSMSNLLKKGDLK